MALWDRLMAAVHAFQGYGKVGLLSAAAQDERYALLDAFYAGVWTADPRWTQLPTDVYWNARQIVKHTGAIVDCYQQLVYSGDLPPPGTTLPRGAETAIPIVPQTGNQADDDALLRAFYTGFDIWQWRQSMSLIPKTAAIYGDVLVVLVDDYTRGVVMPEMFNPWVVPPDGLELDAAYNIKALAIEYDVHIDASTAFGRTVQAEDYRYRKEITSQEFRYYKDGKPFAYPASGNAVQANPYGFVPACWFRHEIVVGRDRGMGAYERTILPALEVASLLSSAIDYQRKQFGAPIGVIGSALRPAKTVTLVGGTTLSAMTSLLDRDAKRRQLAASQDLLPLDPTGKFVSIPYDIGQTRELLEFLDNNLVEENPEAKYAQLLAELRQATGPGVTMTLKPIKAKVQSAANNHDPQMVKLCQMHTSMMGFRLNAGDIPVAIVRARKDRYDAFAPFNLDSYGQGKEDASIPVRDPFPPDPLSKAQMLTLAANLPDWALREMGFADDVIAAEVASREQKQAALDAAVTGIPSGATGPSGPTGIAQATGARP